MSKLRFNGWKWVPKEETMHITPCTLPNCKHCKTTLRLGQKLWSISPSNESRQYGENLTRPWQGKITHIHPNPEIIDLSQYNKETGEPDDDENATASLDKGQYWKTELEAWEAYLERLNNTIQNCKAEIKSTCTQICNLKGKKK